MKRRLVKKYILPLTALLAVCMALAGCFGMYPQPTLPPKQTFGSAEELQAAVSKAKADTALTDEENLKGMSRYYALAALPEGYALHTISVSSGVVVAEYLPKEGGEGVDSGKLIQLGWCRGVQNVGSYLTDQAKTLTQSGVEYTTLKIGGVDFLRTVPLMYEPVTNPPGSTSAVTPEPTAVMPYQLIYWVQDGNAFLAVFPVGFTEEDLGNYYRAQKVDLAQ